MSVSREELGSYLDQCMQPERFQDYCPNGLQVEGRGNISRLATGVTACQQLLDKAIAWGADAVLVHHGYFWRGEPLSVVGIKRRRLATLLGSDVNLFAYHLPLDAHPRYGNNACLGQCLGIDLEAQRPLHPGMDALPGSVGTLVPAVAAADFIAKVEGVTGRPVLHVGEPHALVSRIAWCTGAAQEYIGAAIAAGADVFLTGEASEQTVHVAREEGIHLIAAGHHATERFGVQALGKHLAETFTLEHRFFDIDNPV